MPTFQQVGQQLAQTFQSMTGQSGGNSTWLTNVFAAWAQQENSGVAHNNPLNIAGWKAPGWTGYWGQQGNIDAFGTMRSGIVADVQTIVNNYPQIAAALRSGNTNQFESALGARGRVGIWGTDPQKWRNIFNSYGGPNQGTPAGRGGGMANGGVSGTPGGGGGGVIADMLHSLSLAENGGSFAYTSLPKGNTPVISGVQQFLSIPDVAYTNLNVGIANTTVLAVTRLTFVAVGLIIFFIAINRIMQPVEDAVAPTIQSAVDLFPAGETAAAVDAVA